MILRFVFLTLLLAYLSSGKPTEKWRKFITNDETIFEKDMILPKHLVDKALKHGNMDPEDPYAPAALTAPLFNRWKGGIVPYYIDPELECSGFWCYISGASREIAEAMKIWSEKTCIKFRKKTAGDKDWVHFKDSTWGHCASHIGRIGGEQPLYLGRFCRNTGTVLHEIGHALGFFHEQSRPDRDDHVTINWHNIKEEDKSNFKKYTTGISDMNTPYDYDSIMHYDEKEFSILAKQIEPKVKGKKIGQREKLSYWDAEEMRRYYDCPKKN